MEFFPLRNMLVKIRETTTMKNDIKKLYKKDKKLAIQVAKVLGYKIVAKDSPEDELKKSLKNLKKGYAKFSAEVNNYNTAVKEIIKKLPDPIGYGNVWKNFMKEFEGNFRKALQDNYKAVTEM